MNIELHKLKVRDVLAGFKDSAEAGVVACGGKLDVRPEYQREFVYKDKQRDAVIRSIQRGLPLNVMYWMQKPFGRFEMLDGQQRTISIGQYLTGVFTLDGRCFHNLAHVEQERILGYELMIYICDGDDKERMDWFQTINIAGMQLTDQEIRNVVYAGPWLSDARRRFSKPNCAAVGLMADGKLLSGSPIRQDYLETALSWAGNGDVEGYMSARQHDANADELWNYFRQVIDWVRTLFPAYRKEMETVAWGPLYAGCKDARFNTGDLEAEVARLMEDEDVTRKSGIYPYVLTGQERNLNIRRFNDRMKREAYEQQKGICSACQKHFGFVEMEADHVKPWREGGRTDTANCQMLCRSCNRIKGGR